MAPEGHGGCQHSLNQKVRHVKAPTYRRVGCAHPTGLFSPKGLVNLYPDPVDEAMDVILRRRWETDQIQNGGTPPSPVDSST